MTIQTFTFNHFGTNCYILSDESREAVIIDCGCLFPNEKVTLQDYITKQNLTIKHLLNTHLHIDHVFGNAFINTTYGILTEAHAADAFWIDNAAAMASRFGLVLQEPVPPMGKALAQGDVITFGSTTLRAIHVPGHSPGGLSFYCEQEKCVFSGDSLFPNSIGRTDLPGSSYDELIRSIHSQLLTLPDDTIVYPGHGPHTTIGIEKVQNPYL